MVIVAAADGSALGNPGPAGWAWYVDDDHWAAGGWPHGTNNQGELKAVIDLFQSTAHLDDPELRVLCDSQYVINAVTKWMPGWKRRGWRKADGSPVLNLDLLTELDEAIAGRRYRFEWVKGHAGHPLNEAADERARAVATAYAERRAIPYGPGWSEDGGARFPASVPSLGVSGAAARPTGAAAGPTGAPAYLTGAAAGPIGAAAKADSEAVAGSGLTSGPSSDATAEVVARERLLLEPEVRRDPDRVAALLHPEFVEFGASGRVWSRAAMLESIRGEANPDPRFRLLAAEPVAPGAILVTYRTVDERGPILRSSLWVNTPDGWRLRFHQGTPAAPESTDGTESAGGAARASVPYQAAFDF